MTIKKKQKGLDSRYSDFLSGYTRSWILIIQTVLQAPMLQPAQCFFKLMYLQSKKKKLEEIWILWKGKQFLLH